MLARRCMEFGTAESIALSQDTSIRKKLRFYLPERRIFTLSQLDLLDLTLEDPWGALEEALLPPVPPPSPAPSRLRLAIESCVSEGSRSLLGADGLF